MFLESRCFWTVCFPPGTDEMEADLELFSIIFTIGSNEKYPNAESLCHRYSFTLVVSSTEQLQLKTCVMHCAYTVV